MARSSARPTGRSSGRRDGFSIRALLIGLLVVAGVGALVYFTFPNLSLSSKDSGPMLHTVAMGDFIHDITERGNVESASNIEIRCEVESRGSQGTMILELIEEGANVEPGDILCKLDSSSLEQELVQQQIICNTSEAAVIQAKNNFETAEIALDEYLNGTYAKSKQEFEGNIFEAEENLRVAKQNLAYTEKLYARGYVTKLKVEADEFAVDDTQKKLEEAQTELNVLEKYTKEKMVKQLEADIKTTEAKYKSEEHSHELDQEKLADLEAQIEKCTIVAPDYGQVVYANVTDRRGGSEIIIEEGGAVRERQVIFRLPDPNRMQVKAKINEASVSMVEPGMAAGIRLDAFPDLELKGEVEKVNEYPLPTSFFSGNVKEYETTIRIHLPEDENRASQRKASRKLGSAKLNAKPEEDGQAPETSDEVPKEKSDTSSNAEVKEGQDASSDTDPEKADSPPKSDAPAQPSDESAQSDEDPVEESSENGDGSKDSESSANEPKPTKSDDSEEKVQLRPGMTAEVKIRVRTIPNVLQVPVQAIVEYGGKNYCLMYDKATGWSKREVKIGATNDKTVIIREGLEEGDKVVMSAAKNRDKVSWPKLEPVPGVASDGQPGEGGEGGGGPGAGPGGGGRGDGAGAGGRNGGPGGGAGGPPNPAQAFGRFDSNSDGKLTEDELPDFMKSRFSSLDANGDGSVTLGEFTAATRAFGAGRGGGQGGRRGGGPGGGGQGGGGFGRGPGGGGPGGRPGGGRPGGGGPGGGGPGGGGPGGAPRPGGGR